jgi:PRTRC genetic system protein C
LNPERIGEEKKKEEFFMPIQTRALQRSFNYMGLELADPDPALTPEQVRDAYAAQYPEITTAVIEGPDASSDKLVYKFTRAIGTKG